MEKDYILNNIRFKNFNDQILLTNDHGEWIFLNKKIFQNFLNKNLNDNQHDILKKKGFILTKDNIQDIIDKYTLKKSYLYNGTSLHIIVPTLRCDHQCIYCHASKKKHDEKGYDMDKTTAKNTVEMIFQTTSPNLTIEFQGGEPLLNFEIIKFIIKHAKELNKKYKKELKFSLVSNFIYMDDKKLDYFIKEKINLCTSLDGPKIVHDHNRPKETYKNTVKWIKKIKNKLKDENIDDIYLGALVTVTKKSLKYPKEIVDEYTNLGFKSIHLRFLNNLGDARGIWKNISYTSEEFIKFWKKAVDYIEKINKENKKNIIIERGKNIFEQKIFSLNDPNFVDIQSPCGAIIGQLLYNYNGDILTCDEGRMIGEDIFKLGNVNDKNISYKKITTSNKACEMISASINDNQFCDKCVYKPYCGICPVLNYSEFDNIIGKITQSTRCKIFTAQLDHIFKNILKKENIIK